MCATGILNRYCSSRARLLGHSSILPCAALQESTRSSGSCCFPSLPRKCGKSRRMRACHWQIAPPPSARPSVAAGRPASAAAAAASCSSVPTPVHIRPADELCARLGRPAAPAVQACKCCACSAGRGGTASHSPDQRALINKRRERRRAWRQQQDTLADDGRQQARSGRWAPGDADHGPAQRPGAQAAPGARLPQPQRAIVAARRQPLAAGVHRQRPHLRGLQRRGRPAAQPVLKSRSPGFAREEGTSTLTRPAASTSSVEARERTGAVWPRRRSARMLGKGCRSRGLGSRGSRLSALARNARFFFARGHRYRSRQRSKRSWMNAPYAGTRRSESYAVGSSGGRSSSSTSATAASRSS